MNVCSAASCVSAFRPVLQSVMYNISNIIIQAGVNTLGTDNVTAWATYGKVDGLYWMMINALGISVTTFVGQNYGAGRIDRVRKGAGACMVIGTIMTAIVSILLYLKGYLLIDLLHLMHRYRRSA